MKKAEQIKCRPLVVDWQVTTHCTRNCYFCYGPQNIPELDTNAALSLVDVLSDNGTRVVGITGGEPLIREDLPQILKQIKTKGMGVCLSTNCDLLEEKYEMVRSYIDSLGLPIEGGTLDAHDALRGKGSFNKVLGVLIKESQNSEMRFRIGTVVTGRNINELLKIEKLIAKFENSIVYWKLYDLIQYQPSPENQKNSRLSEKEIVKQIEKLGNYFPCDKIVYDTRAMRDASYLLIKPNGEIFIPSLIKGMQREQIIGNLSKDPENALKKWAESVNIDHYENCIRCIYRKDAYLQQRFLNDSGEKK